MTQTIIDARGQSCPRPLMMTKKALKDPAVSAEFVVLTGSENAKENIERLLQDNGIPFQTGKEENHYRITVDKGVRGKG